MNYQDAKIAMRALNLDGGEGSGVKGHTTEKQSAIGEARTLTYKEAEREIYKSIDSKRNFEGARKYGDPMMMREPAKGGVAIVNARNGEVAHEAGTWHEMHANLAAKGHFPPASYRPNED
jgi:hypothetical protein